MADVNSLSLIVNVQDSDKSGILDSFTSNFPGSVPLLVRNDTVAVSLRLVKPSSTSGQVWDDINYSTALVTMAIGEFDKTPQSGTFTLTYGANTTSGIAYNVSAATLSSTLNALASITSAGGVTVTSPQTGIFVVTFNSVGARTTMSGVPSLFPDSHVVVSKVVTGTASVAEIQVIQLIVDPYALNTTWSTLSGVGATVATLAAGDAGTQNVQSITLSPVPYAGTFQITTPTSTTAAISYDASAQTVQDALGGSTLYTVTGNAGGPWVITTVANGSSAAFTVNTAGLKVPVGLTGSLNLSTYGMFNRFLTETAETVTLKLEIQITPLGGNPGTVLQVPISVSKDVINYSALVPTPVASYYTAAECNALFVHLSGDETIAGAKTFSTKTTVPGVQLDTSATPTDATGLIRWNATDLCAEYVTTGGVVIQIGQEETIYVRNMSGVALANGDAVYVTGANAYRTTVAKATANGATAQKMIGLVTTSGGISNNQYGFVTIAGIVRELDTSSFTEGAEVWLSPTTAGALTTTQPSGDSQRIMRIGYVIRSHASLGSILVATHYHGTPIASALMESEGVDAARAALHADDWIEREGLRFDGSAGAVIGNGGIPAVGTKFTVVAEGVFDYFSSSSGFNPMGMSLGGAPIFYANGTGYLGFAARGLTDIGLFSGGYALTAGKSYVISATGDGSTITCYVNSSVYGTITSGYSFTGPSTSFCYEGSTTRLNGKVSKYSAWNYALTAAEIASLTRRGLVTLPEQRGGSMTASVPSSFNGISATINTQSSGAVDYTVTGSPGQYGVRFGTGSINIGIARKIRVAFTAVVRSQSGNSYLRLMDVSNNSALSGLSTISNGANSIVVSITGAGSIPALEFTGFSANIDVAITSISIIPLGTLFEQDSGQRNAGYMVRDTSGKGCDLILPASGVSIIDPAKGGTINFTTNTNGNQQIGGSQVIIPTNARITSWVINSSGTPTISLGNVSGGAQFVSALSLAATAYNDVTLLTRFCTTGNLWCNSNSTATLKHTIQWEYIQA